MKSSKNRIIRSRFVSFFIILTITAAGLAGCSKGAGNQQTVEITDTTEDVLLDEEKNDIGLTSEGKNSNEVTELDVDNLPDDVVKMVTLCDALNQVQIENATKYSVITPNFAWSSIRVALTQSNWSKEGIKVESDRITVPYEIVSEYAFALFGKITKLPDIPSNLTHPDDNGVSMISFNNNLEYVFALGDRGLSEPKVVSAKMYENATVQLEVMLVDSLGGNEIGDFIYTMRDNSRDTSMGAKFAYEIVKSVPGDEFTKERMSKVPYIEMISQVYGNEFAAEDDMSRLTVEEVPCFVCFGNPTTAISTLNNRIIREFLGGKKDSDIVLDILDTEAASDDNVENIIADETVIEEENVAETIEEDTEAEADDDRDDENKDDVQVVQPDKYEDDNIVVEEDVAVADYLWREIRSYPVTSEKYVQVLMTCLECPNYGTCGDLRTYNYDISRESAMKKMDALNHSGITEDELLEAVQGAYVEKDDGIYYDHAEYCGFIMLEDGSVDFYLKVYFGNEQAEPFDEFASYNSVTGKFTLYEYGTDPVSEDIVDEMLPPLTHGWDLE